MRRGLCYRPQLLLLTLLIVWGGAHAFPADDAQALVEDTTERMLATLRTQQTVLREHPEHIYDLVEDIVLPHFDFERMARLVLGRHWRAADAAQRQRFVYEFRTFLVRTYAVALLE